MTWQTCLLARNLTTKTVKHFSFTFLNGIFFNILKSFVFLFLKSFDFFSQSQKSFGKNLYLYSVPVAHIILISIKQRKAIKITIAWNTIIKDFFEIISKFISQITIKNVKLKQVSHQQIQAEQILTSLICHPQLEPLSIQIKISPTTKFWCTLNS